MVVKESGLRGQRINSLPQDKFSLVQLKAFADDKIKILKIMIFCL